MNCLACHTQMIRMVYLKQSYIWYKKCSICNGVFLMQDILATEPLAETQYVSIADTETLEEVQGEFKQAIVSMAVKIGTTRLIDNVILGK